MGCSGNYGKFKTQSRSESKVSQQKMIDSWTEYNLYSTGSYCDIYDTPFKEGAIVFDPKNDDRKILVGSNWCTINDQERWMEFVKENTTTQGYFDLSLLGTYSTITRVREIWGPDNHLYGFIITQKGEWVTATLVAENTMQLQWQPPSGGNAPGK